MAKEKELYVGIINPVDARRNLLETSKGVIKVLQSYERLRNVRSEKAEQVNRFSSLITEISALIEELKKELPEYNPEDLPKQKPAKIPREHREDELRQPKKPKAKTELDKLESELSMIEEKLKKL